MLIQLLLVKVVSVLVFDVEREKVWDAHFGHGVTSVVVSNLTGE